MADIAIATLTRIREGTECAGARENPDGDMTITGQDGTAYGTCPGCLTWAPLHRDTGLIAGHERQDVGER